MAMAAFLVETNESNKEKIMRCGRGPKENLMLLELRGLNEHLNEKREVQSI